MDTPILDNHDRRTVTVVVHDSRGFSLAELGYLPEEIRLKKKVRGTHGGQGRCSRISKGTGDAFTPQKTRSFLHLSATSGIG
jgi:hypothetical protein